MQEYSWSGHCKLMHTKNPDLGLAGTGLWSECPHGHSWTIVRGRVGQECLLLEQGQGPIWLGCVTSGQGRGPAGWISVGEQGCQGSLLMAEPVVLD